MLTGGVTSAGAHDSGGASGSASGGRLVIGGEGGVGGPAQGLCAPDLQSIVDAQGNVVRACAAEQGCAGGACVAACDAAAASRGSVGCDFWALDPPFIYNGQGARTAGPCYAVFLANAWTRPAKLSVSRAGQTLDVSTFARIPRGTGKSVQYEPLPAMGLPPNEVAILFLSHQPGVSNIKSLECPITPAVLEDAAIQGPGRGAAFHIVSDTPLSAYDILPYGGADSFLPSATLLLPSTSWGTNYVALAPLNTAVGQLWAAVVAEQDGTTVEIAPRKTFPGSAELASAPVGEVSKYTLNAGEALQWIDIERGTEFDPTAAVFESNKPIALWSGNTYLSVPSATSPVGTSDSAHQQLAPIKALGSEYVGGSIVSRRPNQEPESVPYKMLGIVDGTVLAWDPAPPASAPLTLDRGQVAEFETTELFSVRSQDVEHPFTFTQYMPGVPQRPDPFMLCDASYPCFLGDDEWVSLIPTQQFLSRYVFFSDPSYATTTLVVVRRRGAAGFADVKLECLGSLGDWRPVGSAGEFEVSHVYLMHGFTPSGSCSTSRHVATSAEPFGIVVWGTDQASSYAYPAGGNLAAVNEVVVPTVPR